ncbi:MAG TPA: dethiobiotin synthase [Rhodanobacteraceae bacterium]|nr:dethiobiotin synthase [Rhodanobacteraceae bacterium]
MKAYGVFITGTDVGCGKTRVACSLLYALRAAGLRASGMKPVATGGADTPDGLRHPDALALIAASDPKPAYADCNPFCFAEHVSPHIAAAEAGVEVTLPPIEDAYDRIALDVQAVVVEGAGGWLAPLSNLLRSSAIPRQLNLPVILVVGLKPGCLNHAQLSVRAVHANDCELVGWIGNRIDPAFAHPKEHLATLNRVLGAPCLGVVGHDVMPAAAAAALRDAADAVTIAR